MITLLKEKEIEKTEKWYPTPVYKYKNSIIIKEDFDSKYLFKNNFAYNMQYIEYLDKQLNDLKLTSVLITMLYKSYIITSMGIIELLFCYLLKSTGNWNTNMWEEVVKIPANPKKLNGVETKIETHIFEKVDEYDMRMDLDSMIKKIEKKRLLTIEHNVFPVLKRLRELRNRVHLHIGENQYDHDYNKFNHNEILMMKEILYTVLTCKEICNDSSVFEFLNTHK
ncbi:hypothetical protein [Clostridium baratii]|uniref:hypothetical protein n=1 Tax=Clostridium baratii TaxID=1561 RepID=UPI0006BADE41|nr:hypothetical protein [Clostridium baratii]